MRNQPKYHIMKNTIYALKGLKDIIKNESSFRLELIVFFIAIPLILYIDKTNIEKLLLFITLGGVLIVEAINSAIERVVDLVTTDYAELAGKAKDAGSAAVFISIVIASITWMTILFL